MTEYEDDYSLPSISQIKQTDKEIDDQTEVAEKSYFLCPSLCMICGAAKSGKTTLLMHEALIAHKINLFYITLDGEVTKTFLQKKLRELGLSTVEYLSTGKFYIKEVNLGDFPPNELFDYFEHLLKIAKNNHYQCVCIDSYNDLSKYIEPDRYGKPDIYNAPVISMFFNKFKQLAEQIGLSVFIMHHLNKNDDVHGSVSIKAKIDCLIRVTSTSTDDFKFLKTARLDFVNRRNSYYPGTIEYDIAVRKCGLIDTMTFTPTNVKNALPVALKELKTKWRQDQIKIHNENIRYRLLANKDTEAAITLKQELLKHTFPNEYVEKKGQPLYGVVDNITGLLASLKTQVTDKDGISTQRALNNLLNEYEEELKKDGFIIRRVRTKTSRKIFVRVTEDVFEPSFYPDLELNVEDDFDFSYFLKEESK